MAHTIVVVCAALVMRLVHVFAARHWTEQVAAELHAMAPLHVFGTTQTTEHDEPPQEMAPHWLPPPQTIVQELASAQSIPPVQAFAPVQTTLHGIPGGHVTLLHGFCVTQLIEHTPASSQAPPCALHACSHAFDEASPSASIPKASEPSVLASSWASCGTSLVAGLSATLLSADASMTPEPVPFRSSAHDRAAAEQVRRRPTTDAPPPRNITQELRTGAVRPREQSREWVLCWLRLAIPE